MVGIWDLAKFTLIFADRVIQMMLTMSETSAWQSRYVFCQIPISLCSSSCGKCPGKFLLSCVVLMVWSVGYIKRRGSAMCQHADTLHVGCRCSQPEACAANRLLLRQLLAEAPSLPASKGCSEDFLPQEARTRQRRRQRESEAVCLCLFIRTQKASPK